MKAWRKHNSSKHVRSNPSQRITRKEARTFFSAEQAQPHGLIFRLMYGKQWKEVVEALGQMMQSLQAKRFKDPYEGKYLQMIGGEWTKPAPRQ